MTNRKLRKRKRRLELQPISYADAALFVSRHHRHNMAPVGHKYSIAIADEEAVRGVVMVGRSEPRRWLDP